MWLFCVSLGPILSPPYAGGWADIRAAGVSLGSGEVTWLCGQDRGWGTAKRTAQLVPSWAGGCSRHLGTKGHPPKGVAIVK